ncbi:hypothetical protein K373_06017 [Streptomyces sp. DvalAA-21]|nr:hypothetical protein SACTE_2858 [Streptomyces sp. SirexAA-E]PZX31485.1 hypothetical protein K373_06017 [Streptomyces sp. DvalAA-21]RAJ28240.1 hypothetical protein K351_05845 [Streptomyces sp. DpondAA-E10]RAJ41955.1 hypothetical protein K352_05836 [Streptomyces sp. DpondAA-A50]SCD50660.1 hypothetical protein GA0115239_102722 [Streptomyces sp. BpilaLS-43]SCE01087.1 hypothetical protein GA0115235_110659 [Streptomyces sp. DpondAA-F4a]SCL88023.1 hypothetical protein SAMN04883147_102864 [Strepto
MGIEDDGVPVTRFDVREAAGVGPCRRARTTSAVAGRT